MPEGHAYISSRIAGRILEENIHEGEWIQKENQQSLWKVSNPESHPQNHSSSSDRWPGYQKPQAYRRTGYIGKSYIGNRGRSFACRCKNTGGQNFLH